MAGNDGEIPRHNIASIYALEGHPRQLPRLYRPDFILTSDRAALSMDGDRCTRNLGLAGERSGESHQDGKMTHRPLGPLSLGERRSLTLVRSERTLRALELVSLLHSRRRGLDTSMTRARPRIEPCFLADLMHWHGAYLGQPLPTIFNDTIDDYSNTRNTPRSWTLADRTTR